MRRYVPCWESIGIRKERYLELLHFCRQYPEWKHEAGTLIGGRGQNLDGMPHGSGVGDPTALAAERREALMARISMVEMCARSVADGAWTAPLIRNICYGDPYSVLDPASMPTSKRSAFFSARRDFCLALHILKEREYDRHEGQ